MGVFDASTPRTRSDSMLLFFNSLNQGLLRERPLQLGHLYGLPRTAKGGLIRTL
jgi:hypothetical protein